MATNLPTEKIAESIVYLATTLKSDSCSVSISKANVRSDKFCKKVLQINRYLNKRYKAKNFELIDHDNTITERRLNGSELHVYKRCATTLSNDLTEMISNSIQ